MAEQPNRSPEPLHTLSSDPLSAGPPKQKTNPIKVVAIILLVACLVGAAAYGIRYFWLHRLVAFSLNGIERSVTIGTKLSDIIEEDGDLYTSGDYLSITGNVIEEGGGVQFVLHVNGEEVDPEAASGIRIFGDEVVTIEDGPDVTETSTTTTEEIPPVLVRDGSIGSIVYVSQWGMSGSQEVETGDDSQERIVTPISDPQPCIISALNVNPEGRRQIVALTFDDGPSQYTEEILDILHEHGARATFFSLGEQIAARPSMAARVVSDGHELMSHTYSHEYLPDLSAEDLQDELSSTFDLVSQAGGSTTVFRPPYGSFDTDSWLRSGGLASAYVLWNIDTLDWERPGADAIVEAATTVAPGNIILMHDGGGNREQDIEALPKIIDKLHEAGYEFVTVTELMQSDPRIPADIAAGTATMPEGCTWPQELG